MEIDRPNGGSSMNRQNKVQRQSGLPEQRGSVREQVRANDERAYSIKAMNALCLQTTETCQTKQGTGNTHGAVGW